MENIQRSNTLRVVLLCLFIFITAKLLFKAVFGFFEPAVPGIAFTIIDRNPVWKTSWLFALLMAFIPLSVLGTWRLGNIISTRKRLLSVSIILFLMIVAIYLRHTLVRNYFTGVVVPYFLKKGQPNTIYPIDPVNFVYYIFIGLLAGLVICWLVLGSHRQRQRI